MGTLAEGQDPEAPHPVHYKLCLYGFYGQHTAGRWGITCHGRQLAFLHLPIPFPFLHEEHCLC